MSRSEGANPAKSIAKEVSLSGIALHSGKSSTITFCPSESGKIEFVYNGERIEAVPPNVRSTDRGTCLGEILTVEHVLSAVSALGLSSIKIILSENEPPALDGSSLEYYKALEKAGFLALPSSKKISHVKAEISVEEKGASIKVVPYDGFEINFMIDFPVIGRQEFCYSGNYLKDIAPARTFGFIEELDGLKKRGLALGATEKNALVLSEKGYINKPRFADEPVRHKILDLIGDLALVGAEVKAKIFAVKSGHKLNIELARLIRNQGINQYETG